MADLPFYERISAELAHAHKEGLWRTTRDVNAAGITDFSTNSYLSLQDDASCIAEADRLCEGQLYGNMASRLIACVSPLYGALESEIADWKKTQAALVFNSGYAANLGIIAALCTRDTEVFCDRLNHASILDGILISRTNLVRYRHCDMNDLAHRLRGSWAREKIIVTESVFSMDGDIAPLADICALAQRHKALVVVDEAHAVGVFGDSGCGVVESSGCSDGVDVTIGTLSKAIAGAGGYFAGNALLRDYFVNFCRSLIYSTALPHSVLAWNLAAIRSIRANPGKGRRVLELAAHLRILLTEAKCNTGNSVSQIVPCLVGGNDRVLAMSQALLENGMRVPAIRSPTVAAGQERLRFSVNFGMNEEMMKRAVGVVVKCL